MVLTPTDNTGWAAPLYPVINPSIPSTPMPGMITQRTILSSGSPMSAGGIANGLMAGHTQFVNGVPIQNGLSPFRIGSPVLGHSCQGNGGAGCSCGGNCAGGGNTPIPQSIQSPLASNSTPTLEQIVARFGKLTPTSSSVITTGSGQPEPVSLSLGPCFQIIHFDATESWDEIIEPGTNAQDIIMIVPCIGGGSGPGGGGIDWGIGVPVGGKGTQIISPDLPDSVQILCKDPVGYQIINDALVGVLNELKKIDLYTWHLKGCSDKINNLISCLRDQASHPKIPSISCGKLKGNRAMETDSKGFITVDIDKALNTDALMLEKELMHEFIHNCGVGQTLDELDTQIMTMFFYGTNDFDDDLVWYDELGRKHTGGTLEVIHGESGKPDTNGYVHGNYFAWNESSGAVSCINSDGTIGNQVMPPTSINVRHMRTIAYKGSTIFA
jgi:hypothetical protein